MAQNQTPAWDLATLEAIQKSTVEMAQRDGIVGPWAIGGEQDTVDTLVTVGPEVARSQLQFLRGFYSSNHKGRTYEPPLSVTPAQHRQMVEAQKGYVRSFFDFIRRKGDENGNR